MSVLRLVCRPTTARHRAAGGRPHRGERSQGAPSAAPARLHLVDQPWLPRGRERRIRGGRV